MALIRHLVDVAKGKHPLGTARSGHWPTVRKNHLVDHPVCEVCGGDSRLQVHHRVPFHLHPELELEPTNLITLCEADKNGINCHLAIGHLGSYKSFNLDVDTDSQHWNEKLKGRP